MKKQDESDFRYFTIAKWIYAQQRWVTRREIGEQFGLCRAAVGRFLHVIAAKQPGVGLLQSKEYNRGSVSVRVIHSPDIWKNSDAMVQSPSRYPIPYSGQHARWLALIQLPWSSQGDDERFRGDCFREASSVRYHAEG